MPTGKRASMREGPLAALFRKTAEDTGGSPSKPAEERAGEREHREVQHQEPEAQRQEPEVQRQEPEAQRQRHEQPSAPREPAEQPDAPSPQERLRHAFSADIPRNLMERPASEPATAAGQPHDVYARPERVAEAFAPAPATGKPVLRVVGVGGAGVNAINRMVEAEIESIEFLAINTDLQSLQQCAAHETLHIGDSITRGLGSGSNPDLGRQAAREEYDRIKSLLRGSDMVFIAAGAGGGTGTGAAPIVAQIARELGALAGWKVTRPVPIGDNPRIYKEL